MGNTRMFHKARRSEMSTKPPREGLVNALVSNSKGKTFEEARREWTSDGEKITWEDAEFHEHCPCGAKLEVANYILVNQITGRKLQIGSDCIRKFIILTGTETQEDSRKAFDRLVYNVQRDAELVRLAPNILQGHVPGDGVKRVSGIRQDLTVSLCGRGKVRLRSGPQGAGPGREPTTPALTVKSWWCVVGSSGGW